MLSKANIIALFTAVLPIILALIVLYADVQSLKGNKADYREVAELRVHMTEQLSKNTEAINNLNKTNERILRIIDTMYPEGGK